MAESAMLEVALRQTSPIPLDVRFTCARRELIALVGPSGAGKTSVLRAIAGLVRIRAGRIAVGGETWLDPAGAIDVPPHRREVGFVFQSYALFPHMSALGNVAAALGHLPSAARHAEARDWLRRMHLEGLEDRRPGALSGGQQQRVAMARALARRPKVLLLDEPFAAVDKVTRRKLYAELAELRSTLDIPCVLVTHDLDEAAMLADRMAILRRGATIQLGTPEDVMRRPASVDVARLIDLRNIFAGRLVAHEPEKALSRLEWAGATLETAHRPDIAPGTPVTWCIPPSDIVLHRRDRPSRGERENPVRGSILQALRLGDTTLVALRPDTAPSATLYLSIPSHVAMRNGLQPGTAVGVSLLAGGIHLMPWDPTFA
ncbi:MAG: ABC transporter ATP-binding protein [Alphaproteobacteria bacterium]|nr:ABC transporter ATP-binding protein [Alphaproteobacteria bacterium]